MKNDAPPIRQWRIFGLIKRMIHAKEWRFITDDDQSLYYSLFRVFSKEVRLSEAHHFIAHVDKSKEPAKMLIRNIKRVL